MSNIIEVKYRTGKRIERLQIKFVWLLPRWIVKWAVVRATLYGTNNKWGHTVVPDVTAVEILKRWDESDK